MNRGDLAEQRHAPLFARSVLTGRSVLAQHHVGQKKGLRQGHQNRDGYQKNGKSEQLQIGVHFTLSRMRPHFLYAPTERRGSLAHWVRSDSLALQTFRWPQQPYLPLLPELAT